MNRHGRFYAELARGGDDEEDYYEDDYDYDQEDYYDEEGEYYEEEAENGQPAAAPGLVPPKAPVVVHTAFSEADVDYEILDSILPALHDMWRNKAPTQLPLKEEEAVAVLREQNFDVEATFTALLAKRRASAGTGAKILKVASAKKNGDLTEVPSGASHVDPVPAVNGSDGEEEGAKKDGTPTKSNTAVRRVRRNSLLDLKPDLSKPDCTFVIAGHVDAGKSTTLGHLLLLLGRVTMADVEKNAKIGRASHKESFKFAWLLDQSEEERRRGVTIDSGSFCFETEHRRINILDAPGHKDYVLSMISSATQADAAMLVVTAAPGEFEAGLQHGTKDHLQVLKTLGVGSIIVAVNKMDAAGYDEDRYNYIVREIKHLLKQLKMPESRLLGFCPISGMEGTNISVVDRSAAPWYEGPSLVELLDSCPLDSRLIDAPLRVSLQDVQGNILYAKIESGRLCRGANIKFLPCDVAVAVKAIDKPTVGGSVGAAFCGETVELHTSSSLIGLYPGSVGCEPSDPVPTCTSFQAHIQTFSTLNKSIIPGATFTMVLHALTVTVKVGMLISKMDAKGNWSKGMVKCIPANAQGMIVFRTELPIALMPAEECRALGRFVLQQDGETVAGGLVKTLS